MRFLKVQRLPVIPLAHLVDHLRHGTPLPEQAVVITLDDGYKTARAIAGPILKEFGFPFTVFVYPQFIGRHTAALSWEDLRAMAREGVDVESHSLTHPLLTHPSRAMDRAEYLSWVDQELRDSRRLIEAHLGQRVRVLAYPFGGYDETVVERARRAGYLAALTCDDGNVNRFTDLLHLNRRLVYRTVRRKEFAQYFGDRCLRVGDLSPRDGERVKRPLSEIKARILDVERIRPESVRALVDRLGKKPIPVAVDRRTGYLHIPLPTPPKRGYYFVSLFAQDRSLPTRQWEASWLFIISENTSKK